VRRRAGRQGRGRSKVQPVQLGEVLTLIRDSDARVTLVRSSTSSEVSLTIDALHKWRLTVNKNTVIYPKLVFMFPDKGLECISIVIQISAPFLQCDC